MFKQPSFKSKNVKIYSLLIATLCVLGVIYYTPTFFESKASNANLDFFSELVQELDLKDNFSEESGSVMEKNEVNLPDRLDRDEADIVDREVAVVDPQIDEFLLADELAGTSDYDGGGNPYLDRWLDVTENQIKYVGPVHPNIVNFCETASGAFSNIPNVIYDNVYNGTNASILSDSNLGYCQGGSVNRRAFRLINPTEKLVLNINVPGGSTTRKWEVSVYFRNRSFGSTVSIPLKATVGNGSTTLNLTHDGLIHHKSTYQDNFVIDTPGFHKLELENTDTNGRPILLTFVKIKSVPVVEVPTLNVTKTMVGYDQNQQINWNTLPANKEVAYRVAWNVAEGNISLGDLKVEDTFTVEGAPGTKIYDYLSFSTISGIEPTNFEFIPGSSTLKWKLLNVQANSAGVFEIKFKVKDIRTQFNCSDDNECGPFNVLNKVTLDSLNDMMLPVEATHNVKYFAPKANSLFLENYQIQKPYPQFVNVTSNGSVLESGVTAHSFTLRLTSTTGTITATNVRVALELLSNPTQGWNGGRMDLGTVRVISPTSGVNFELASETFNVASISSAQPLVITFNAYYNKNHGSKPVPNGEDSKLESQVKIVGVGTPGINYFNNALPVFAGLKGALVDPFTITKTVDKAILNYPADGNLLNYEIKVTNNSNIVQSAYVEDTLPQIGNTGMYLVPKVYPDGTLSPDGRKVFWRFESALGNVFAPHETKTMTIRAEVPGGVNVGTYNLNNVVKVSVSGFPDKQATALTVLNITAVNALYLENYNVRRPYPDFVNVSPNGTIMVSGATAHSFTLRLVTSGSTPITASDVMISLKELRNHSGYNGGAIDFETIRIISPSNGVTYDASTEYFTVNSVSSASPLTVTFNAYYNRTLGTKVVPENQISILENEVKIYSTGTPSIPFYNHALPIRVGLKGAETSVVLNATKTVTPNQVSFIQGTTSNSGKVFTYGLRVENTGNANISNLIVTDILPIGLRLSEITFTATGGNEGVLTGNAIVWDKISINAGGFWAATITAPVDVTYSLFSNVGTYPLKNRVEVKNSSGTVLATDDVTSNVVVTPETPLSAFDITKSVSKVLASNGDTVNFTVVVRNTGNTAGSVLVKDTIGTNNGRIPGTNGGYLISNGQYLVTAPNGTGQSGSLLTSGGLMLTNVPANSIVTITYGTTASVPVGVTSVVTNIVIVSSAGVELDTDSETVTLIGDPTSIGVDSGDRRRSSRRRTMTMYPVMPFQAPVFYSAVATGFPTMPVQGGMFLNKQVSPTRVDSGREATYTIQIKNQTADFKVVNVYDSLGLKGDGIVTGDNGSKITYVKNSLNVEGSNFTGNIDQFEGLTLLDVEANETVTLTYRVIATGNGAVENEVSITGGEYANANLQISGVTNIINNTKVSINKSANKSQVNPNDYVDYTLRVTNNTGENAKAVNIKDALPAGLDFISSPNQELKANGQDLEVDLGDLAPGESRIVRYTARVDSNARAGQKLPNEAGLTYVDGNNNLVGPIFARELVSVGGKVLFVLFVLFSSVALVKIVRLGRQRKTSFNI